MTRASIIFLLCASAAAFAQVDSAMETIDLRLGENNPPILMLVELNSIGSGVVFKRLPHIASCPASRPGDFALKKVNGRPGGATAEHISMICTIIDSVTIDTTFVYEVHTAEGRLYYMRMIELVGKKVKVKLTTTKPTAIFPGPLGKGMTRSRSEEYRIDGRSVEEWHRNGVRLPKFQTSSPAAESRFP